MPDYSLINTEGLTRPVTVLIEKVSNAVGALWEPKQIRRVEQAKADAAMILAHNETEIDALKQRAFSRFADEETRRQENMESILGKAIPNVNPDAPTDKVEGDFITNFFEKSRSFSDQEMQTLWAAILSGEANNPGSFSRKTVNLVADLDKNSAELFRTLCSFGWRFGENLIPLIFDLSEPVYRQHGLTLYAPGQLEAIGLARINEVSSFRLPNQPKRIRMSYCDVSVIGEFSEEEENVLLLGKVIFTPSGSELSRIVEPSQVDGFYEFVAKQWAKEGLVIHLDG